MRHVVITGGNKGIGLAIVTKLLEDTDWHVHLGARDQGRGEAAAYALVAANPSWRARLDVLLIDPSSDAAVEGAARRLAGAGVTLHGIVNNAGGFLPLREMLDLHLYGPKRVVEALLPLLEPGGAIVNVTSGGAATCAARSRSDRRATLSRADLPWEQIEGLAAEVLAVAGSCGSASDDAVSAATGVAWSLGGYGFTKALLNCYTCALQAAHPHLRVAAVNPGFIETDLSRPFLRGCAPAELGMRPPADGAAAPCALLLGEAPQPGRYRDSDGSWRALDEMNPSDFDA